MVTITARNEFVPLLVQGIRADKFKHCSLHQSNQNQGNPPENNNPWFLLRKATVFYIKTLQKGFRVNLTQNAKDLIKFTENL